MVDEDNSDAFTAAEMPTTRTQLRSVTLQVTQTLVVLDQLRVGLAKSLTLIWCAQVATLLLLLVATCGRP